MPLVEEAVRMERYRGRYALLYKPSVLGDLDRARSLLIESPTLAREARQGKSCGRCLRYLDVLVVAQGRHRRGVRPLAAAAKAEPDRGSLYRFERIDLETSISTARSALGDDAFADAWIEGEAMALEEAVADALEEDGG